MFILIYLLRKGHVFMNQPTGRIRTKDISVKELRSCLHGCLPLPSGRLPARLNSPGLTRRMDGIHIASKLVDKLNMVETIGLQAE